MGDSRSKPEDNRWAAMSHDRPYKPRRYLSTDSPAMATVGREFTMEQNDRVTQEVMSDPSTAKKLRRDLLIGVAIIVVLLLALSCVLLLLP